jgi:hypothetical protein
MNRCKKRFLLAIFEPVAWKNAELPAEKVFAMPNQRKLIPQNVQDAMKKAPPIAQSALSSLRRWWSRGVLELWQEENDNQQEKNTTSCAPGGFSRR